MLQFLQVYCLIALIMAVVMSLGLEAAVSSFCRKYDYTKTKETFAEYFMGLIRIYIYSLIPIFNLILLYFIIFQPEYIVKKVLKQGGK